MLNIKKEVNYYYKHL